MNTFILLLSLFGIISLVQAEFSIETSDKGLIPSNDLYSIYNDKASSEVGGYHKAEVYLRTKVPSINFDQKEIADLSCGDDGTITVKFTDESAMESLNDWPEEVMVLISHRWKCFGKSETQFYFVGNKTVDVPNKSASFTTQDCDPLDWSEEFLIDVSWVDGEAQNPQTRRRRLSKRNRFDRRQKPIELSKKLDLSLLFDEKTGKSSKPNFPLIELGQNNTSETLLCANCFLKGEATITMRVSGKIFPTFKVNEARITLNGNLLLNLDLSINGKVGTVISPPDLQILTLPLTPLGVPNLFSVGPSLDLSASAEVSADITGTLYIGSEISMPDFSINASLLDDQKFNQSGFDPVTKTHEPSVGVELSAGVSGSLKPQLAFGIDILNGAFDVKAGVQLVTTLGTKISVGTKNECKGNPRVQTTLNGNVGLFVQSASVPIFEFPSKTLDDQCIDV